MIFPQGVITTMWRMGWLAEVVQRSCAPLCKGGHLPTGAGSGTLRRSCNARTWVMKTPTFPTLRVDPELRKAAEEVLQEGETLSAFVEASVRAQIERRKTQEAFIARGLASRSQARQTGRYVDADRVLAGLEKRLLQARTKRKTHGLP